MVRPGGVLTRDQWALPLVSALLGRTWSIRIQELGAYMTYLAVGGDESDCIVLNPRIVEVGKRQLCSGIGVS